MTPYGELINIFIHSEAISVIEGSNGILIFAMLPRIVLYGKSDKLLIYIYFKKIELLCV